MKRCPECRRDYHDDSLLYCLEDGAQLVQGSVPQPDEPATAILHAVARSAESSTREQADTIERTRIISSAQSSTQKRFNKRPIAIAAAVTVIVLAGVFGFRYFSATKQIGSIAIMPFVNDSGNPDVDYLSDGMTETLISSLSQLPSLNVKPRSLVFRYKGKDASLQSIGQELGVQAVLNGTVVSRGSDLSLYVELIDVATTKVIWSRQYNRTQADIVSLQSEIARDVSSKLRASISGDDEAKVTRNGTADPEAYRLYLLGNSFAARRKTKDLRVALDDYQQAIALDPNYALAYTGLASVYTFLSIYGGEPGSEALPKARAAALKAIEIDPSLAEPHNILGGVELFLNHDFAANERENRRALELNPNLANAYRHNGLRQAWLGHFDEALASFHHSLELEPLSPTTNVNVAWCLLFAGRTAESDAQAKVTQDIDPTFWFTEFVFFMNARVKGDHAAAIEHLARTQELRDEPEAAAFIREAFKKGGWDGFMRAALADPARTKIWDYYLAGFAIDMGDKDRAFALLNNACDKYDQFVLFLKIDPEMQPLRDDPRYADIIKRLGFPAS